MKNLLKDLKGPAGRRAFMKKGVAAAGTATLGAGLLARGLPIFGQDQDEDGGGHLTKGDVIVVPAGTPHWFKEVPKSVSYYVVKVLKP